MAKINKVAVEQNFQEQFKISYDDILSTPITPFQIVQGAYDVVNGVITDNPNITNESQFKKVFTGQNSVVLIWRDSQSLVCSQLEPDRSCKVSNVTKDFKVGRVIDFKLDSVSRTLISRISDENPSNAEMLIDGGIGGFFDSQIPLELIYDGWVFPEISNEIWLIDTINEFYFQGVFAYSEIIFKKFTTQLNNPEFQIEQLINFSSVGEGYAFPIFNNDNRSVLLDENKLLNRSVKYIQVEFSNPAAISNIWAVGRAIVDGESPQDEKLQEWNLLLPSRFLRSDNNQLSGVVAPSELFYFTADGQLTIDTFYQDWRDKMNANYNQQQLKQFKGHLRDEGRVETLASSPDDDTVYWDNWIFSPKAITYSALSVFSESTLTFPPGIISAVNTMAMNVFSMMKNISLPIAYNQITPYSFADLPIIGNLLNLLNIGVLIGWENIVSLRTKVLSMPVFISKDLYNFLFNTVYEFTDATDEVSPLPLDAFTDDVSKEVLGKNTLSSIFKIELTELVDIDGDNQTIVESGELGKDTNDDDVAEFLWNSNSQTQTNLGQGYAIDRVIIQAMAESSIRITFYDLNNQPITTQKYQSSASRTGSVRDWTTIVKTSSWTSNIPIISERGAPVFPPSPTSAFKIVDLLDFSDTTGLCATNTSNFPSQYQWLTDTSIPQPTNVWNGGSKGLQEVFRDVKLIFNSITDFTIYNKMSITFDVEINETVYGPIDNREYVCGNLQNQGETRNTFTLTNKTLSFDLLQVPLTETKRLMIEPKDRSSIPENEEDRFTVDIEASLNTSGVLGWSAFLKNVRSISRREDWTGVETDLFYDYHYNFKVVAKSVLLSNIAIFGKK